MSTPSENSTLAADAAHLPPTHGRRVFGLDLLRALAVLPVVFVHGALLFDASHRALHSEASAAAFLGVELFFVLSGFLIGGLLLRAGEHLREPRHVARFWQRRWMRTLPNYFLFLGVNVLLDLWLRTQSTHLLNTLTFTQNLAYPFLGNFGESWSLAVEEWFYLLLPVCLFLFLRAGIGRLRAFTLASLLFLLGPTLARVWWAWPSTTHNPPSWESGVRQVVALRLDALMYGMLAAAAAETFPALWRRWRLPAAASGGALLTLCWLLFALRFQASFFGRTFFFSLSSLGCALLLPLGDQWRLTAEAAERVPAKVVHCVAVWSYSLYLSNLAVYRLFANTPLARLGKEYGSGLVLHAAAAGAIFGVSAMVYRFFEKPLLQLRPPENPEPRPARVESRRPRSLLVRYGAVGLILLCGGAVALRVAALTPRPAADHVWVAATYGDDANPGTESAPCKTLAAALVKVVPGGEIVVLGAGEFGPARITKPVTISGGGSAPTAGSRAGIVVDAGSGSAVVLRNLLFQGDGEGARSGVRCIGGGRTLRLENCVIAGFGGVGVEFSPTAPGARLEVKDCQVRENRGGGILIKSAVSTSAFVEKTALEKNQFGLRAEAGATVTARDCAVAGNTANGFLAYMTEDQLATEIELENCRVKGNGTNGIKSEGARSSVRFSGTVVTENHTGLKATDGGAIIWLSNNRVLANGPGGNGSATATAPPL